MRLEPFKSYAIVADTTTTDNSTSFAVNLVLRYIVELNLKQGVTIGQNIFGRGLTISDTAYPTKSSIIISRVDRKHQDFVLLSISDHKWDVLFQILNLPIDTEDQKALSKFLKANLKTEKSLELLYYRASNVVYLAYNRQSDRFDVTRATHALNSFKSIYRGSNSSRTEQLVATINFIKNPTESLLFEMLRCYGNDFKQISLNIQAIVEDTMPRNIIDMFEGLFDSNIFIKNVLQIMSYVVLAEDYNDFTLQCLKLIK